MYTVVKLTEDGIVPTGAPIESRERAFLSARNAIHDLGGAKASEASKWRSVPASEMFVDRDLVAPKHRSWIPKHAKVWTLGQVSPSHVLIMVLEWL